MDTVSRERLPQDREGTTRHFVLCQRDYYATINSYPDGRPAEMFLKTRGESGGDVALLLDLLAQSVSISLQYGAAICTYVEHWRGTQSAESCGSTGEGEHGIPFATSLTDYLARWLASEFPEQSNAPSIAPTNSVRAENVPAVASEDGPAEVAVEGLEVSR